MSRRTTSVWNLVFQYLALCLGSVRAFVLVPLTLRQVRPDIYGGWLAAYSVLQWLTLLDPGVSQVILPRVAAVYAKGQCGSVRREIRRALLLSGFLAMLFAAAGLVVTGYLPRLLKIELAGDAANELLSACRVVVGGTAVLIFTYSLVGINRGLQGSVAPGLIGVIDNLTGVAVTMVCLAKGGGIMALAYGVAAQACVGVVGHGAYLCLRLSRIPLGRETGEEASSLTWGRILGVSILGRIGATLATSFDTIVIARFFGPLEVVSYTITRRPLEFAAVIAKRPGDALMPALAHLWGAGSSERAWKITRSYLLLIAVLAALPVCWFWFYAGSFVEIWVGKKYFAGAATLRAACVSVWLATIHQNICAVLSALGEIGRANASLVLQGGVAFIAMGLGAWAKDLRLVAFASGAGAIAGLAFILGTKSPSMIKVLAGNTARGLAGIGLAGVFSIALSVLIARNIHPVDIKSLVLNGAIFAVIYCVSIILASSAARAALREFLGKN